MPLTAKQEEFKIKFAQEIRARVSKEGHTLAPDEEMVISERFIESYIRYKENLSRINQLSPRMNGEIIWCLKKHHVTVDFAKELEQIFTPLGGFKPKNLSAFWSGVSVKRAAVYGKDFGSTIVGYALNRTQDLLKEAFTSLGSSPDELISRPH